MYPVALTYTAQAGPRHEHQAFGLNFVGMIACYSSYHDVPGSCPVDCNSVPATVTASRLDESVSADDVLKLIQIASGWLLAEAGRIH